MDFFSISRHWKAFDCLFFCILPLLAPLKEEVAKKQSAFYYQLSTWWMLQWISRQREVMEQYPAASSSHPAPREYDRDLQCPSLSGEQEERTYLQVERWPRYAAYEDERQDNSEARRKPIVQNASLFMEKEVRGPQKEVFYTIKVLVTVESRQVINKSLRTIRNYPKKGKKLQCN